MKINVDLLKCILTQIMTEMRDELDRDISDDEVRVAAVLLDGSRASGPGRFLSMFYQRI